MEKPAHFRVETNRDATWNRVTSTGAPERQLRKALNGDENAEHYLLESGIPLVQFVGRNIGPVPDLSEPDWGAEPVGFRI